MTFPLISGYTTTFNCIERSYPFEECICALLEFCDEVVVADAGSVDGTIEAMRRIAKGNRRVRFFVDPVDFSHPRWAIYMDGYLKAKARRACTGEYCWQTDTDEIVPPQDWERIRALPAAAREVFKIYPVLHLPMVEFWGGFSRIRADFISIKPRFSLNDLRITHGIPRKYRSIDASGHEYPTPFDSDSCNYMWSDSEEGVPVILPIDAPEGDMPIKEYEVWFNHALELLPCVLHVSWLNLKRKIHHYREFWPKFHASMYNLQEQDCGERNVMFDKPWSEVTDEEIERKAQELQELGPRSFHRKLDKGVRGPTIAYGWPIPDFLEAWAKRSGAI